MDILTGLVIWAAQALTLSLLLFMWWMRGRRERFALTWSGGFGLLGLGMLLVGFRPNIPSFLSIEIANTMILAAIGLLIGGMQQFDGRRIEGYVLIPALLWVGGMLLPVVHESFNLRVALYNGSASVGFAIFIAILLRSGSRVTWGRRALAIVLGVHIASSLTNASWAVISAAGSFTSMPSPGLVLLPGAFCFVAAVLAGAQMLTERSEEKLKALATSDPLTGVLNRRGLMDEFDRLCAEGSPDKPLIAVLHFDLDNFKQINDRCGHQGGDDVLKAFCQLASISLSRRGSFGRMGGEEFAAMLRVADFVEAASIAEGLRMTLALQPIRAAGHSLTVTVSGGIALESAATAELDRLLPAADRALYAAKKAGRNCTAIDQPGGPTIIPSATMLSRQEMALEIQASEQVTALRRVSQIAQG
ncbi:diguanylate cyclase (GGDEF)-like protein [Pseudorhizobium tarimense]|uniref:diguanylate cyclase n=1 Tax=Pseudorhizobium tarimense TaxID=1079109 RepID=A0ABV2H5H0_9HYPH|nr:GGDEF domain-containing protein [Pseudorhizobium tarimense]MCJ8518882.1 GGDEF domain-containing protein [Pseudorhizobium tarimense]